MLLDCRSEEPVDVPLSDDNLVIIVTNSNVKHKLAGSQVLLTFHPVKHFRVFSRGMIPQVCRMRRIRGRELGMSFHGGEGGGGI